jgi:probable F420-dependent oxidoreductase
MVSIVKSQELHFGASLPFDEGQTVRHARRIEELGFEYLAVGEHYMQGKPPLPTSAALPILGVAAGATENIRLLSSILLAPFYHPTVLAKLTTSLDNASRGRLTLGIGVGGEFPAEFEAAGLNIRQRGSRTNECLDVLRRLWSGERVTYAGRHFQLDDVAINPLPSQEPHPPIWVAGRRDVAMLRAARYGEGWYPYFYDPARYRDSVQKITRYAGDEGRDLSDFQWAFLPYISIYPTVEEAAEVALKAVGGGYRGNFERVVHDYWLLGPVEQCVKRLQEYVEAGARHIVFNASCPYEDWDRHLETISKEIVPRLMGNILNS